MMTFLFLLSLVLALPTFGLSVVAFIVIYGISVYLRERSRHFHVNVIAAEQEVASGARPLPSWFENSKERDIFLQVTEKGAVSKGVPPDIASALLSNTGAMHTLYCFAGAMESRGSSFSEQSAAVSDKIRAAWSLTPKSLNSLSNEAAAGPADSYGTYDETEKDWRLLDLSIRSMIFYGERTEHLSEYAIGDAIDLAEYFAETEPEYLLENFGWEIDEPDEIMRVSLHRDRVWFILTEDEAVYQVEIKESPTLGIDVEVSPYVWNRKRA